MRADIREATRQAAKEELRTNECYVVLVSKAIADELHGKWSPPVQLTMDVEDGMATIIIRTIAATDS